MSKDRNVLGVSSEQRNTDRPDFFGYYKCQIVELLSQDHDVSLSGPETSTSNGGVSDSLFSGGVGTMLSDFKSENLKTTLRRAVTVLSSEVDNMDGPVKHTSELQIQRRNKMQVSRLNRKESEDGLGQARKKVKAMPSTTGQEQPKVNDDVKLLLVENNSELDEIMTNFSDELYTKLDYMEQQLEELLDASMSTCRFMTLAERKHILKTIKVLPRKNLEHIAELVQRNKPAEEKSRAEVTVNLERENNVTLWRMYYYTKTVENAKKLPK